MTTIAYKDGIVAYDSRITADLTIISDDRDKRIEHGAWQIFFSGSDALIDEVLTAWPNGEVSSDECGAIAVAGSHLYVVGVGSDHKLWRARLQHDEPYAIGSGAGHALTAMDLGCTAAEAIAWAAKRDCCTGGRIRQCRIDGR